MASLSAARSPSQQQSNTTFLLSPHGSIPNQALHPSIHHLHHHHQPSPSTSVVVGRSDNSEGLVACTFHRSRSKIFYESDFSSPTSWEFRENNFYSILPPPLPSTLPLAEMPASAFPSTSGSPASTPSPLDEAPYHVQMHLSLLQGSGGNMEPSGVPNCRLQRNHHSILATSCHSPLPLSNSAVLVQNVSNAGGGGSCACASAGNCNGTIVMINGEPDLSGNGSDGSRNSTGSHRSQDSGFSDSGETRKGSSRKCPGGGSSSNETFSQSVLPHPVNGNGMHQSSNGNCNGTINFENGNDYHHHTQMSGYDCMQAHHQYHRSSSDQNGNGSCEPLVSPQNGYHYAHIYDCIPMPSPILPSGLGCGRLVTPGGMQLERGRATSTSINASGSCHREEYSMYTVARRPASVDISALDSNATCNGGGNLTVAPLSVRMSPSPPPITCSNCLSSSGGQDPYGTQVKRSFSPQRTSSPSPHDIALLASSCTATANAALRVPLRSSTPKRFSNFVSSSSKLGNKIDNFESLKKNVNKDKDNNNNSNNSGSANNTPGKSGNKTFTVLQKEARSSIPANSLPPNGTVLAEDSSRVANAAFREMAKVNNTAIQTPAKKSNGKTAAESIYDKICSRLSGLSSSSSSSSSSSTSTPSTSTQQTQILHQSYSRSSTPATALLSPSSTTNENETVIYHHQSRSAPKVEPVITKCETSADVSKQRNDIAQSKSVPEVYDSTELTASQNVEQSVESKSKGKLKRTSSTKWQSLPRGVSSKRLSLLKENSELWNESSIDESENIVEYPVDVGLPSTSSTPTQTNGGVELQSQPKVNKSQSWKAIEEQTDSQVVRLWLHDLRSQTEPECLHSLQTKWIVPVELYPEDEEQSCRSISPATTVTSGTMTSGGRISSSSEITSTDYNRNEENCRKLSSSSTSSCSYVNRQLQRRSQQRFLSSMTAAIHAVSTPLMSIRNVEMTANIISGEFSKICKHLEFGIFTQVPTLVLSLVGHIEDFLRAFHNFVGFGNLKKLEGRLENACYVLHMAAKSMNEAALMISSSSDSGHNSNGSCSSSSNGNSHHLRSPSQSSSITSSPDCMPSTSSSRGAEGAYPFSQSSLDEQGSECLGREYHVCVGEVVEGVVTVGNLFSQVVDLRLTRDLACILDTIECGGIPARVALKSLATVLAEGGNHMCRLAADIRTVRGLLGVLLDTREDQDKILALRCLATVLCVGEAVKDFDKAGGFEIIADLVYEPSYSMWMKIEAVAVLTQATDPWIDLETTLMTLGVHLEKFIVSLTNLTREFKTDEEPFLLIVAAISNLTFLEVISTGFLKKCRTVSYLIDAVQRSPSFSVFILDHIATILANMAGVDTCRQEIIQCGGIDALLQFLQQRPTAMADSTSAVTACERLQQKSTIALSRLCNEDGVAHYVFDRGGVHRLITLCRKEKERNYSDGVLIAALATLRKLVTICGNDAVKGLGAEDLIEPRLLDSFLLYSSRQESYV